MASSGEKDVNTQRSDKVRIKHILSMCMLNMKINNKPNQSLFSIYFLNVITNKIHFCITSVCISDSNMNIIGSAEWCRFQELGMPAVKARVDSGAKTSTIQADNIKPFVKDGQEWVKFEINPIQDNRSIIIKARN